MRVFGKETRYTMISPLAALARLLIGFLFFWTPAGIAGELHGEELEKFWQAPWAYAEINVRENSEFYGLASYYNNLTVMVVSGSNVRELEPDTQFVLADEDSLAVVGRFKVLLIRGAGISGVIDATEGLQIQYAGPAPQVLIVDKNRLVEISAEYDALRYHHLWPPLAWLSKMAEEAFTFLHAHVVSSWGWAILVFTIVLKIVLLPIAIYSVAVQRRVSILQSVIEPKVEAIKRDYDGEEAHNRMMAVYKEQGVTPFYSLKPLFVALIQVPILIAVFNALGEMPQLAGSHFWWIEDIAYPDSIASLGATIPWIGTKISLLPLLMTLITVSAALLFQNRFASPTALQRQRINLYVMATLFLVLFYPFPAAMVLFWTATNFLQTIQQQVVKI